MVVGVPLGSTVAVGGSKVGGGRSVRDGVRVAGAVGGVMGASVVAACATARGVFVGGALGRGVDWKRDRITPSANAAITTSTVINRLNGRVLLP